MLLGILAVLRGLWLQFRSSGLEVAEEGDD
jgi:hypothetical protein